MATTAFLSLFSDTHGHNGLSLSIQRHSWPQRPFSLYSATFMATTAFHAEDSETLMATTALHAESSDTHGHNGLSLNPATLMATAAFLS